MSIGRLTTRRFRASDSSFRATFPAAVARRGTRRVAGPLGPDLVDPMSIPPTDADGLAKFLAGDVDTLFGDPGGLRTGPHGLRPCRTPVHGGGRDPLSRLWRLGHCRDQPGPARLTRPPCRQHARGSDARNQPSDVWAHLARMGARLTTGWRARPFTCITGSSTTPIAWRTSAPRLER